MNFIYAPGLSVTEFPGRVSRVIVLHVIVIISSSMHRNIIVQGENQTDYASEHKAASKSASCCIAAPQSPAHPAAHQAPVQARGEGAQARCTDTPPFRCYLLGRGYVSRRLQTSVQRLGAECAACCACIGSFSIASHAQGTAVHPEIHIACGCREIRHYQVSWSVCTLCVHATIVMSS